MSAAWVFGHGSWSYGHTFVPTGRRVFLYADNGETVTQTAMKAVIAAGDLKPVQVFSAGERIRNRELYPATETMPAVMASVTSRTNGTVYIVGGRVGDGGIKPLPLTGGDHLTLCTFGCSAVGGRSRGRHHAACKGLFNLLDEDDLHLLTCLPGPFRATLRVATGDELPQTWDADIRRRVRKKEIPEDDRLLPTMLDKLINTVTQGNVDPELVEASECVMPQATQAILLGGLKPAKKGPWGARQETAWPREKKAPRWMPAAVYGHDGYPPDTLAEAWEATEWRNAFWIWMTRFDPAGWEVRSLLVLFSLLRTHAGGPVTVFDEDGQTVGSADRVLDTEILHYCRGGTGVAPPVDSDLVDAFEDSIAARTASEWAGTQLRTEALDRAREQGFDIPEQSWENEAAEEDLDIEPGALSPGDAQDLVQQCLDDLERSIYPTLQEWYERFTRALTANWNGATHQSAVRVTAEREGWGEAPEADPDHTEMSESDGGHPASDEIDPIALLRASHDALKETPHGERVWFRFTAHPQVVLTVGSDHPYWLEDYEVEGYIRVEKARGFHPAHRLKMLRKGVLRDPGILTVMGCPTGSRAALKKALSRVSQKEVAYD